MPSAIDATKPISGLAQEVQNDSRSNWERAKAEIEDLQERVIALEALVGISGSI